MVLRGCTSVCGTSSLYAAPDLANVKEISELVAVITEAVRGADGGSFAVDAAALEERVDRAVDAAAGAHNWCQRRWGESAQKRERFVQLAMFAKEQAPAMTRVPDVPGPGYGATPGAGRFGADAAGGNGGYAAPAEGNAEVGNAEGPAEGDAEMGNAEGPAEGDAEMGNAVLAVREL